MLQVTRIRICHAPSAPSNHNVSIMSFELRKITYIAQSKDRLNISVECNITLRKLPRASRSNTGTNPEMLHRLKQLIFVLSVTVVVQESHIRPDNHFQDLVYLIEACLKVESHAE